MYFGLKKYSSFNKKMFAMHVQIVLLTTFLLHHYALSDTVIRTCEPIRVEMCRSVGYNNTSMPNLVGHELQSDADFTLQTFTPLIQYGCSAQLHFFLCAAYFPYCTPKVPVPIGPCRGLCEAVRARCHPVLQGFGFPWPHALDCDRFPKANNLDHMCMKGPDEPTGGSLSTDYLPTKATSSLQPSCQGLAKSHLYVRLNRSGKCAPLCEAEIMFNTQDKSIAELWVSVWSVAAMVIAVAAVLSFIISDTKWDKILMPLVSCNSLVAVGWIVRILAGRNSSSCGIDPQLPGTYILLTDGLSNAPCATTFLLRYYFGMSASVWWAILCLKWHFTVRRERDDSLSASTVDKKYDETYSSLTQLTAWGLPAIQTLLVLVTRLVDADELIGACYVGNQSDQALRNYVATPLFGYWVFGAVNLLAGYLVQRRTTSTTHRSHIQPKNVNSMNGMGSFLFIIACCLALLMIAVFYEFANIDIWLHQPQSHGESTSTQKVPMWSFMMRTYMELLVGVISCGWTLGPRFSNLWKNRFCLRPVERKLPTVNYPQSTFSTASYQTVCPQNSMISLSTKAATNVRKYQPPMHIYRKVRVYKSPSQSISLTGNETVL